MRRLSPETAHALGFMLLRGAERTGLLCAAKRDDPILAVRLWKRDFPNPIGLAAGFDKNATAPGALLGLGFGFVEVGTVTPRPQHGTPRPRLFRLPMDKALINRMGFNNEGLEAIASRLVTRPGWIGANVGCNRDSPDAVADYVQGVRVLAPRADYLVINVSSPNTPGLRALQGRDALAELVARVRESLDQATAGETLKPPLLVKIAPDLTGGELADIAAVTLAGGVDGMIATNTTIDRPSSLRDPARREAGGLSGRPLFRASTAVLTELYRLTEGRLPLIGVGGVGSGAEALAKITAGASLVQIYTALIYEGPGVVERIKRELAALLRNEGYRTLADAVGTGVKQQG
ncbi:MAG: dihydroorotate dehydrogenase [Rhodospirillaceae bacterium]|nr:MAG: dihydroorotate dehydrogenase [Rhodospirillaceae bacterium]